MSFQNNRRPQRSGGSTAAASDLPVFDPNTDIPDEPPPSYDESVADPSIPDNYEAEQPPRQPLRPPEQPPRRSSSTRRPGNSEKLQPPLVHATSNTSSTHSSSTSTYSMSTSVHSGGHSPYVSSSQFRPPPNPPTPTSYQASATELPPPTAINPNPYLPWRYSPSYRCSKCENTGFKKKNGHPCKKCWGKFRPGVVPPKSQAELERLTNHKPAPKPLNPNVFKLPPGTVSMSMPSMPMVPQMPMAPQMAMPMPPQPAIVSPGDPRIGGVLCPRCKGRGMVHFFLDLERCHVCNGLGRVASNGRPL